MAEVNNPHHALFKARFSRPLTAVAFCRHYLPPEVVELFDLERLEVVKDAFTDEGLRHHLSDMLYRVALRTGGTAQVHLLIEHKSWPDAGVNLQLARYLVQKWAAIWEQGARQLPVIVPVVLYHGKHRWELPRNFAALFNLAGPTARLRPFVPDFSYYLCDLSQYDEIAGGPELAPALLALKYAFRRGLRLRLADIIRQAAELRPAAAASQQIEALITYWRAAKRLNSEEIVTAMEEALPGYGHIKIPWIEQWREEGRAEGRAEGWAEGAHEAREALVLGLLRRRFQELDKAVETRIRALSEAQLQELGLAVLDFRQPQDLTQWLRAHKAKKPRRK